MFIPKSIDVYVEKETFKDIDETFREEFQSGKIRMNDYSVAFDPYICIDEETFSNFKFYLETNDIYFIVKDYTPERTLIRKINDITESDKRCDNWKAEFKYGEDVILYKDNKDAAYIHITQEPFEFFEDTLKTARVSFNKAVCTQSDMYGILCEMAESYGCTALSKEQQRLLERNGYDFNSQVLDIGNGFSQKMQENTHLEILLNEGVYSFEGRWHGKDEVDKDWRKYAGDIPIMTNAVIMRIDETNEDNERLIGYSLTEIYGTKNKSMNYSVNLKRVRSNLVSALPYVFKAYKQYDMGLTDEPIVENITDSFTAEFPTTEYYRKFHLSCPLPDGREIKGFVNVTADTKEELPEKEEMKGEFMVEKLSYGWASSVKYDEDNKDSRYGRNVIITGVYDPVNSFSGKITSTKQAENMLESVMPVKLEKGETIPRFKGRLEEHIYSASTLTFENSVTRRINERNIKAKMQMDERQ